MENGLWGKSFLVVPNLQDVPTQIGEIVMDMCHIGVRFICRSYFLRNLPVFFQVSKNKRFYNGANGDRAL